MYIESTSLLCVVGLAGFCQANVMLGMQLVWEALFAQPHISMCTATYIYVPVSAACGNIQLPHATILFMHVSKQA